MTAHQRWQHATAAYSLLYRVLESDRDTPWAVVIVADRLRAAGDPGLAAQVEELTADGWYPADSEIRPMLDRVAEVAARLERECLEASNG